MARRVLLIVDRCGPADALRIRPLVESVCRSNPGSVFDLVCSEQAEPVLADVEGIGRVVVSRLYGRRVATGWRSHLRKAAEVLRLVRQVGPRSDQAVILLWGGAYVSVLARLAARRAVGFETNRAAFLLQTPEGPYRTAPDYEQNLALLEAAGLRVESPRLRVSDRTRDSGRALLARSHRGRGPLVVLHPGSDWACQQWRPELWAKLIDELRNRSGADVVVTGSGADLAHVERIAALAEAPFLNLVGKTTLRELEGVLAEADLCVSVDSVAYDTAQAAGTPAIVLAGPSAAWVSPLVPVAPIVLNRTGPADRKWISGCQDGHTDGRCQDWACPFAGLPQIRLDDVLAAVDAALTARSGAAAADEEHVVGDAAEQPAPGTGAVKRADGGRQAPVVRTPR